MRAKTYVFFGVAALGALLGLVYSGVSTADFVAHLDRQPHQVNCSLMAGLTGASDLTEEQPCKTAMYSPYSSFWREKYWGGVPVSLFALGVFGFALALCIWAFVTRRGHDVAPGLGLLLAGVVAAVASVVFFIISVTKVHAMCTTCMGTYISSAILLIGAALAFLSGRSDRRDGAEGEGPSRKTAIVSIAILLVEMGILVFLPVIAYVGAVPDYTKYITECETIKAREDKAGVLLQAGSAQGTVEAIVVVDPLCPFCKEMDRRMKRTRFMPKMNVKLLPLPLDADCNTMLADNGATTVSGHEGSCILANAMICAPSKADAILEFAYENQDQIRDMAAAKRPAALREKVVAKFPDVDSCLDSSATKIKMNNVLRWASANGLTLQTPQIFINGRRLCDSDTDLGLEYALARLIGQ